MFWIGLVIGLFIGANVGIIVLALCRSASRNDQQGEKQLFIEKFEKSPVESTVDIIFYNELVSRAFGIPPEILFSKNKEITRVGMGKTSDAGE